MKTRSRAIFACVVAALTLAALAGCAAGGAAPPMMDEGRAEPEAPPEAEYERILGSFTVRPEGLVLLTPELSRARLQPRRARSWVRWTWELHRLGTPQAEAVASLNAGAIAWFDDRPEEAYRSMMTAQQLFADVGDVEGFAHVYAWLGFFFAESGAITKAEEHLALAHELFGLLRDDAAQARILRLAPGP